MRTNKLFVDGKPFYTTETAMTGAEIKKLGGTSNYQLYYEMKDGSPDKALGDGEAVRLDGEILHFFAVPQATI